MNDDPVLDLFPFDFLDVSGLSFLPPIAGGSPDLEDFGNVILDIITAPWDIAKKVGEMVRKLWDQIWDWIGGALRWVWDWLCDTVEWLSYQLLAYFTWVGNFINASALWVKTQIWNRVGDAIKAVEDWGWKVFHQVEWWVGLALTAVGDWGWKVFHQVEWWCGLAIQAAKDAGDYVWKQVVETANGLFLNIWDAANWLKNNILPPIMGGMSTLGDAIGDAFELVGNAIREALEAIGDKLADAIKFVWTGTEELIETLQRKMAIPGKVVRGQYSSLEELLDDAMDPIPFVGIGIAFGALLLVMIVSYIFQTAVETYVTPMSLPQQQATMARVGAQLLTVGVVQDALNRGFIDEGTADDHLSRMGYSGSAKQAILELRNIIPGPTDLVRMAVRECFNPQLRRELTLDAEFPAPFAQFAALQGISEEWAGNYWAAHWDLPSPSQGYEMLHRGIINEQQLADLLKALDYAPVWRDKLQAISYNPITRVDLRRLFKMGIINEAQVKDGYKALGYNDERAGWLTEFTKKNYSPEDKSQIDDLSELAVTTIRLGYRRHVLSRDEALDKIVEAGYAEDVADFLLTLDDVQMGIRPDLDADVDVRELTTSIILEAYRDRIWERDRSHTELETLGYLPGTADLLLALEDYKLQRELMDLETTVIKEEYLANGIDRQVAGAQLDALEVLPERRDLLLQRWDLDKAQKPQRLTLAQLQRGFKKDLLTPGEFLDEVKARGYNDKDAQFIFDIT